MKNKILSLLGKNRTVAAKSLCEKLCRENPHDENAWYMLAGIHAQMNDFENVISCCDRVLAINNHNSGACYNRGVALQQLGRIAEAEQAFRDTLRISPDNAQAYTNLSLALRDSGNIEESVDLARKAVKLNPGLHHAHNNLGLSLKDLGNLDEAVAEFRKAIDIERNFPEAYYNLGLTHALLHNFDRCVDNIKTAIRLNPDYIDAYIFLSNEYRKKGQYDKAFQTLGAILDRNSEVAAVHNSLGLLSVEMGDIDKATSSFDTALILSPGFAEAYYNLGTLYYNSGDINKAKEYINTAIRKKPVYPEAYYNLGLVFLKENRIEAAKSNFEMAIQQKQDFADAYNAYACATYELEEYSLAVNASKKAIEFRPDFTEAWCNLGDSLLKLDFSHDNVAKAEQAFKNVDKYGNPDPDILYKMGNCLYILGKYDESIKTFERALSIDPDHSDSIAGKVEALERLGKYADAEQLISPLFNPGLPDIHTAVAYAALAPHLNNQKIAIGEIERILNSKDGNRACAEAYFSLGKLYDDIREYENAFRNFEIANSLDVGQFNMTATRQEFASLHNAFTRDKVECRPRSGNTSMVPVFIIGMPRSGTSLIEQILSSHHSVFGAGELEDIGKTTIGITERLRASSLYPDAIDNVSKQILDEFAEKYLSVLAAISDNSARVIDKMPHNFMALGLLDLLFPDCHVIHCKRDPMDTCLSIYFHHFNDHHAYSRSLIDLGNYYRMYHDLMEHWKSVLRIPIIDIKYESVVSDPGKATRELLDFCELDWDENCLRFHESGRLVRTPSYNQVRRPIYNNSLARWKHYEPMLKPLQDSLSGVLQV